MDEFQEPLSLATFEADKTYPPYLTTPRSLEACRMNGVNPIELVEIPVTEFQKDFPNDPDAAQRRFERIDGARRRTLAHVREDWNLLVSTGWHPPASELPMGAKETIIKVRPDAHCALLEQQAEKFRKIERDNWESLNRMLRMEVMKADEEQRGKKIIKKQEEIQGNNEEVYRRRIQHRQELYREQLERQKRKEEEFLRETKLLQQVDQKYAIEKAEQERLNALKEKQFREQREAERVARTDYTLQLKNSIVHGAESKIEAKKKILALREKNTTERMKEREREQERYIEERRRAKQERLQKARDDQRMMQEAQKQEMLERIAENEAHRQRIYEQKERQREEQRLTSGDIHKEKHEKIKSTSDGAVQEKAERTQRALLLKEELARQELIKVREAQEKRRCIKAIRQEAFEMASTRAKKCQDYKLLKLEQDIKNKEERCKAIKNGFHALNHMRNSMKDIMEKTAEELKNEMNRLRHDDAFAPEKVIAGAVKIGDKVLFPRLQRTFGISQDAMEGAGASDFDKPLQPAAAELFPAGAFGTDQIAGMTDTAPDEGAAGARKNSRSELVASRAGGTAASTRNPAKKGADFDPLPIQAMTPAQLRQSLSESQDRVRIRLQADPYGRENIKRAKSSSGLSPGHDEAGFGVDTFDNYYSSRQRRDSESNDQDPLAPHAILKLPPEDEAYSKQQQQHQQQQRDRQVHTSSLARRGNADDVKLPEMKFDPLGSSNSEKLASAFSPTTRGDAELMSRSASSKASASRKQLSKSQSAHGTVRLNENDKAKFLEPPAGQFRREMSMDHPLAKGGTGKYKKEISSGFLPTGLKAPPPKKSNGKREGSANVKSPASKKSSVAEALDTAAQIERLTYSAQSRVVDPQSRLELLKRQQNATLKRILQEEREAEEQREQAAQSVASDPEEKRRLDTIFAEERRRASERIIAATREHEDLMKQAVLGMMDLGSRTNDNRLPVDQKFHASVRTA